MSVYRVLSASICRGSGILSIAIEDSDSEANPELEVEGQPEKTIRVKTCRIVYDGDSVSNRRIFVINIPNFPIDKLIGQRLRGKSRGGNPGSGEVQGRSRGQT